MSTSFSHSTKISVAELSVARVSYSRTHICDASAGVDSTRLLFVSKGSAEAHISSADYVIPEGSLVYIPEGTKYRMLWHGAPDIEYYLIKVYSTGMPESSERYGFQLVPNTESERARKIFMKIYSLMERGEARDRAEAISLYFSLYAELLPSLSLEKKRSYHPAVEAALAYIDAHYAEECDIEVLAGASYISASRLYHLFSDELGTTPVKHRNSVRIMHALQDLKTTSLSLEDIAARNGFHSATYFRETFKKYSGMTPTEYRKMI